MGTDRRCTLHEFSKHYYPIYKLETTVIIEEYLSSGRMENVALQGLLLEAKRDEIDRDICFQQHETDM